MKTPSSKTNSHYVTVWSKGRQGNKKKGPDVTTRSLGSNETPEVSGGASGELAGDIETGAITEGGDDKINQRPPDQVMDVSLI